MNSPPPISNWVDHYERLREHALNQSGRLDSHPRSWQLVVGYGVADWIKSWNQKVDSDPPRSAVPPPGPPPADWQNALTSLLAQMTLSHYPPTPTP